MMMHLGMIVRRIHLLLAGAALASLSCQGEPPAPPPVSGRVEIAVTDAGYMPSEIHARHGEPLTMVFTRMTDSPCGEEVVVPDHDIRKALPVKQPVEITFTPTRTGRLAFMCGMDMMKGAIIVQ
jgi:plastocyanin domain-containing protein